MRHIFYEYGFLFFGIIGVASFLGLYVYYFGEGNIQLRYGNLTASIYGSGNIINNMHNIGKSNSTKAPYFSMKKTGLSDSFNIQSYESSDGYIAYKLKDAGKSGVDLTKQDLLKLVEIHNGSDNSIINSNRVAIFVIQYAVVRNPDGSLKHAQVPMIDEYGFVVKDDSGVVKTTTQPAFSQWHYNFSFDSNNASLKKYKYNEGNIANFYRDDSNLAEPEITNVNKINLVSERGQLKIVYRYTDENNLKAETTTYVSYGFDDEEGA